VGLFNASVKPACAIWAAISGDDMRMVVAGRACVCAVCALTLAAGVASTVSAADAIRVAIASRSSGQGELLVLTLTTPAKADAVTIQAFERRASAFQVDERTWRALVGIDLGTRAGRYPISIIAHGPGAETRTTSTVVVTARMFPTRRLQVAPAFVNPPADELRRIARDTEDLNNVWAMPAPTRLWDTPFVPPVSGPSNSRFGSRSIFNGEARSPHSGDDFAGPVGEPVLAPNAGRIALARDLYFTGNTVVVDHGLGLFSLLAHLSVIEVQEGGLVRAGQRVGRLGATGRVTGPHLHWAVRVGSARVDPLSLLALLGRDAAPLASPVR
jgi:murein DD-endopeptidase MepM/ murein hydrolase activator NlpD